MRGPFLSTKILSVVLRGSRKGACPLAGGAAVFAAWGEPSRPGFPCGKRERGVKVHSLLPQALIFIQSRFSKPPIRPASIRTL